MIVIIVKAQGKAMVSSFSTLESAQQWMRQLLVNRVEFSVEYI